MSSTLDDSLFEVLGNPGKYQFYLSLTLAGTYLFIACNYFNMTFYGWIPPFHCKTDEEMLQNVTDTVIIVPVNINSSYPTNQCEIGIHFHHKEVKMVNCREFHGWIYETHLDDHTIVTEWDLVCDKQILINICSSVYFAGVLLGGIIFGSLADKFGRQVVIFGTLITCLPLEIAMGFANRFWQFVVLRFFIGFLVQGLQLSGVALLYESVSHQWKYILGPILYIGWGVGILTVAVIAFFVHHWRYMQFTFCIINALSILSVLGVMESPRWLITQGKYHQGIKVLQNIVIRNSIRNGISAIVKTTDKKDQRTYNILSVFRTPKIRKYIIIHLFLWFIVALVYYGLCLDITNQPGDKNINALVGAILQVVHFVSILVLMKRCKRQILIPVECAICGICCLVNAALPRYIGNFDTKWILCSFYYVAMVIPTGTYAILVYYVSETFPTVLRGIAIGLTFAISRLGMLVTSLILYLKYVLHDKAPIYIYAILAFVSIFLTLQLPETLGQPLPNTIEDIEGSEFSSTEEKNIEAAEQSHNKQQSTN